MGIVIYVIMTATAFLGYVLPWGQMSFWAAAVITNFISVIPYVGKSIVVWILGGWGVCNPTLNAFYSLHYLFIKSCHSLYTSWWVGGTCAWFNKRHACTVWTAVKV